MTLGDIITQTAQKYPDNLAVVCRNSGVRYTYNEFNKRINRLANALKKLGIRKGERLAVIQHNSIEYIEIFFAAFKAGIAVVPLDHRMKGGELSFILNNSEATAVFIGIEYADIINSIQQELNFTKYLISLEHSIEGMQNYQELINSSSSAESDFDVNEKDLATLCYTSGTTGRPKGVMMLHKNLLAATTSCVQALPVKPDDITLHTSPFSHIASSWPLLTHCYTGGANIIIERFVPSVVLDAIEEENVTTWNSVPTMIQRLIEEPEVHKRDYSNLRWVAYGASPMPVETLKRAISIFGNRFIQVYGLTETYLLTLLPIEDHILEGKKHKTKRLSSCGRSLVNCQVRVVNDDGKDVKPGQVGEIIAKGNSITNGYLKLPKETSETIKDGWFYTGDMASVDNEAYIYIIGRRKDIIISGGENISPREVEEIIYKFPSILEAAVIGVPDEKWGEAVCAVVVLRQGKKASEKEIIDYCKLNLASYKAPKLIQFTDRLPKTASGKILKRELRERYLQ